MTIPKRLPSLDVLRALAVFLVIGRHVDVVPVDDGVFLGAFAGLWRQGGWIGVDLFFVLSGFLISGLLFREYQQFGKIRLGRFFVRRGLKIYPPFFALLAVTIVVQLHRSKPMSLQNVAGEMFFLQNYVGFLWNHTWSLAVEEHFYLMLPLLLVLLVRFGRGKADPFAGLPLLFMVLAGAMLCLRIMTAMCSVRFNPCTQCYPTHLRIDSLMFGVCCSYFYHWKHEAFVSFFRSYGAHLRWVGIILLVPAFVLPIQSSPFLYTAGFTLLYVASGLLLCSTIVCGTSEGRLFNGLAFIGTYSYSIYLWHMPMNNWGLPLLQNAARNVLGVSLPGTVWIGVYLVGSVVFGIAMAKLIEFPVLRLRDRFFPARTASLEAESVLSRQTAYEGAEVPCKEPSVLASTDSPA